MENKIYIELGGWENRNLISKLLQETAFKAGYTWISGSNEILYYEEAGLVFDITKKQIGRRSNPGSDYKVVALDQALTILSKPDDIFVAGHKVEFKTDTIKIGCVECWKKSFIELKNICDRFNITCVTHKGGASVTIEEIYKICERIK